MRRLRMGDRVRIDGSVGTVATIAVNSIGAEMVRVRLDRGGFDAAYSHQVALLDQDGRAALRSVVRTIN